MPPDCAKCRRRGVRRRGKFPGSRENLRVDAGLRIGVWQRYACLPNRRGASMTQDASSNEDRGELSDQLQASEARWRAVVDSAVDGIVVIDARGCIELFNPGAER